MPELCLIDNSLTYPVLLAFPLVWFSGTKEIPPLIGQTTPSDDWLSTEFCSKHYSDTLIAGSFQALSVISSSPEQGLWRNPLTVSS